MERQRIIFILPNIYECINGVSTKYIKFINFLINSSIEIVIFTTFKNKEKMIEIKNKYPNTNIIKVNGLNIPFYNEIKIPTLSFDTLNNEIKVGNEIIIFNGEFIWLYDIFKKIRNKYKNIKFFPTMHTDYQYYIENSYKNLNYLPSINNLNHLNQHLENKIFNGIIVTGQKMFDKYSYYTDTIFNANEVDLDIFNNYKQDLYNNLSFNIIFCGRISKEKNIEEILEYFLELDSLNKYQCLLHIIGDGPYLKNIKDIIDIIYIKIKKNIIFYGNLNPIEINNLYHQLDNRIFLFTSQSETFGKTPMEAGATGIPIFIKKSDITDNLYINNKNSFIFDNKKTFLEMFEYFINLDEIEKKLFILNSINNIKKYDQNIIFHNWYEFLTNGNIKKNKTNINFFDVITLFGISKFINCSGMMLGD
jgi:hypothetical protein